jgi:hypothetical protein
MLVKRVLGVVTIGVVCTLLSFMQEPLQLLRAGVYDHPASLSSPGLSEMDSVLAEMPDRENPPRLPPTRTGTHTHKHSDTETSAGGRREDAEADAAKEVGVQDVLVVRDAGKVDSEHTRKHAALEASTDQHTDHGDIPTTVLSQPRTDITGHAPPHHAVRHPIAERGTPNTEKESVPKREAEGGSAVASESESEPDSEPESDSVLALHADAERGASHARVQSESEFSERDRESESGKTEFTSVWRNARKVYERHGNALWVAWTVFEVVTVLYTIYARLVDRLPAVILALREVCLW